MRAPILLALIFLLLLSLSAVGANSSEEVKFLALGHVYTDYGALASAVPLINKENPDFVIFLGDSTTRDFDDIKGRSWAKLQPLVDQIKAPVYFVAGNHDLTDNPYDQSYLTRSNNKLFQEFTIKDTTFISLNSVTGEKLNYDISQEQFSFLKKVYAEDNNQKIIFLHHCLFYQDNNQLCNARGELSKDSVWNSEIVPFLQNKNTPVFVGDVGSEQPYFSYKEQGIDYFGVGFSFDSTAIPQHMLKVVMAEGEISVTPLPIIQDLTKSKSKLLPIDNSSATKVKKFILENLKLVLSLVSLVVTLLLLLITLLLLFIKKELINQSLQDT
jgi:predicted phosphodiesterase